MLFVRPPYSTPKYC